LVPEAFNRGNKVLVERFVKVIQFLSNEDKMWTLNYIGLVQSNQNQSKAHKHDTIDVFLLILTNNDYCEK